MLTGALSWSYAETGSVRLNIVKAGFIVGIGGGSGTLNFQGRNYQLSIGGINVGTIGASAVDLVGTAENLRTAADIVGTYSQGSAALAIVGRKSRRTAECERRGFKSEGTRDRS